MAHSLGAFAGPLAVAESGAERLVLLAPMIPKPGETAGEWWDNTGHQEAIADLIDRYGEMGSWGPAAFSEVFLHDVDSGTATETERYAGVPGAGMFSEPCPLESWPDIPTNVLAPTGDRLFPLDFQRRVVRERLGIEPDMIDGGHLPMLSRPEELARRLVEIAGK